MTSTVKVLADTFNLKTRDRLTTLEVEFARVNLAEFNTHRAISRNVASSRAIPISKVIEQVKTNPYIPTAFSLNKPGMNASRFIQKDDNDYNECRDWWLTARNGAIVSAELGIVRGLHKQVVNRLLEPFQTVKAIVSATEWQNFFNLRTGLDENGNPLADLPIYELAVAIRDAINESNPKPYYPSIDHWHLPFIGLNPEDKNLNTQEKIKVTVARCARVSYRTHYAQRSIDKDLELFDTLAKQKHLSPFEHIAHPSNGGSGNFTGFIQARRYIELNWPLPV